MIKFTLIAALGIANASIVTALLLIPASFGIGIGIIIESWKDVYTVCHQVAREQFRS